MSTPSILKRHGSSSKAKRVSFGNQQATQHSGRIDEMTKSSSKPKKNSKRWASSRDELGHSSIEERACVDTAEEEYEVEAILAHKKSGDDYVYLLKWKGYSEEYNTWEPASNLFCVSLLSAYKRKHGLSKERKESLSQESLAENSKKTHDSKHHLKVSHNHSRMRGSNTQMGVSMENGLKSTGHLLDCILGCQESNSDSGYDCKGHNSTVGMHRYIPNQPRRHRIILKYSNGADSMPNKSSERHRIIISGSDDEQVSKCSERHRIRVSCSDDEQDSECSAQQSNALEMKGVKDCAKKSPTVSNSLSAHARDRVARLTSKANTKGSKGMQAPSPKKIRLNDSTGDEQERKMSRAKGDTAAGLVVSISLSKLNQGASEAPISNASRINYPPTSTYTSKQPISASHIVFCIEHDHNYFKSNSLIRPLAKSPLSDDLTPPPSAEPCEDKLTFTKPPSPKVYSVQISPPPTPPSPSSSIPLQLKDHLELHENHTDPDLQRDTDSPVPLITPSSSDLYLKYSSSASSVSDDADTCSRADSDATSELSRSSTTPQPQEEICNFSEELRSLMTKTYKIKKRHQASSQKADLKNRSLYSRRPKGPMPLPRFSMRESATTLLQTNAAKVHYPSVPNVIYLSSLKGALMPKKDLDPTGKKQKKLMLSLSDKVKSWQQKKFYKSSVSKQSSIAEGSERKALVPVLSLKKDVPSFDYKAYAYKDLLMNWQYELNKQRDGTDDFIYVENTVDMEPPPADFNYICSNMYAEGVPDPSHPDSSNSLCGCECYYLGRKCGPKSEYCCAHMAGSKFAYTIAGKVRVPPGTPIYECNAKCSCPSDCSNRIVQLGRKIPLCIFRTEGRGWGVKATGPIKPNTFVTEYVGEVITNEEAEKRGKKCDAQGITYLFDLDFEEDISAFTVDAAKYGNISHFFNHSCDPNLVVYSVWIDTLDKRLPRLAFFTRRSISEGEELTFDYQMNRSPGASGPRMQCLCGASNCAGYFY